MALQFIVKNTSSEVLEKGLFEIDEHIEIFEISDNQIGVSIPTKVLDSNSEDTFRNLLSQYECYDLWQGEWIKSIVRRKSFLKHLGLGRKSF